MSAAIIILASFGLALAVWLVPASVNIVSWSPAGIGRIAVFAPLWTLWITLAASVLAAAAVWFAGDRSASGRAARARVVAPGTLLWIWTIPFLPSAGDRFPLLLTLAGPARWLIAAAAVGGILYRWSSLSGWTFATPRATFQTPGRRTVFAASLALYLILGFRSLSVLGLNGDEPHYLVITHSLLVDRDLKIENNHAQGDYRAFSPIELRPDFLQRGRNGEIYSIHAPGLSALLLPGYAIAGSYGAVATACFLAALAALAIFDVAALLSGAAVAWATWASACLTVPFVPHAWSLYPEVAALAIVAWTVSWSLEGTPATPIVWALRGTCLAILPWLHTKFVVLLAAMTLWLVIRLRSQVRACLALVAPIALSGAAWLAFFYVVYGRADPQAPYGSHAEQFVRLSNLPRSVLGMLFDQKFGFLVYAPIYLVAGFGAWLMLRDDGRRSFALAVTATAMVYALSSARYYMWWGGASAPARFLVPLVPLFAPMIATGIARARGLWRANVWALVVMSLMVPAIAVFGSDRFLLLSDAHGAGRLFEQLQGSAPLTKMMPAFTEEDWRTPLAGLAPWIGAMTVALGAAILAVRRGGALLEVVVAEGVVFVVAAAILGGSVPAEARADSVVRGRLALMDSFEPYRLRAFDYESFSKISPEGWLAHGRLDIDVDRAHPANGYGRLGLPMTFAPGRYDAKVWFREGPPLDGDLLLTVGRGQALRHVNGPLSNPTIATFELPVQIQDWSVQLTELSTAQNATRIEVTPIAIVPASRRIGLEAAAIDAIPTRVGAYIVYTDRQTAPEGGVFWTDGTGRSEVLVVPAGATEMALTLHVGPTGARVRLEAAGKPQDIDLQADQTKTVTLAIAPDASYVSVAIQSSRAFRPVDVDPESTDSRSLGCQVRIEVR